MYRIVACSVMFALLAIKVLFGFSLKSGKFLVIAEATNLLALGKNYQFAGAPRSWA
jgi:hypothetical protein